MYGSWHRYGLSEPWRKPQRQASVIIEIARELYICFNAKECELMRAGGVRERLIGTRLSLDLLAPGLDLTAIPRRARDFLESETFIADVLLDQRIACGIGNVYKSEVLFLHCVHPLATLGALPDDRLLGIYRTAAELLRRNLQAGPRVTRFENDAAGELWVYRRAGLPCFECGTPIRYARQGRDWRSTYWCSRCQPEGQAKAAMQNDADPPSGAVT
jgi:endonuclease-8